MERKDVLSVMCRSVGVKQTNSSRMDSLTCSVTQLSSSSQLIVSSELKLSAATWRQYRLTVYILLGSQTNQGCE